MSLSTESLVVKALLALEEAEKACGDAPLPHPYWLRFCLAYLYVVSGGPREPFDAFWKSVTQSRGGWSEMTDAIERRGNANAALEAIYRAVKVQRTPEMMFADVHRERRRDSLGQ